MGLFDNIIGTANDGEAAVDMDTIIENLAHPKETSTEEDETSSDGRDGSTSTGGSGTGDGSTGTNDETGTGEGATAGTGNDDKDDKKKKKERKHTDEEEKKETIQEEVNTTHTIEEIHTEIETESEIDIGGDMSTIDLTITDEIVVSGIEESIVDDTTIPGVQIDTPREQVAETPKMDIAVTMDVASTTPPLISEITPITQIDIHNTDTMPIEPVTSLLDITEPTPQISILDIGAETIVPDPIITPIIVSTVVEPLVPVQTQPSSQTTQAPISGSLGDKIGGFAEELRGLKAADELLLQEKQDAKKRLEDAKKAIEDAEKALDTEIQRIRDDEAAIDDTLASLKKR